MQMKGMAQIPFGAQPSTSCICVHGSKGTQQPRSPPTPRQQEVNSVFINPTKQKRLP
jgi:hypothetical protein